MAKSRKKPTKPAHIWISVGVLVACIGGLFLFAIARPSVSPDGIDVQLALTVTPTPTPSPCAHSVAHTSAHAQPYA